MALKFSLVCDTLAYVGWNALANPREVFTAAKAAGYDGVDLPGDLSRVNVREIKSLLDSLGLTVPAIQGAWAAFHAGENRDLCGADQTARQAGIRYAKQGIDDRGLGDVHVVDVWLDTEVGIADLVDEPDGVEDR